MNTNCSNLDSIDDEIKCRSKLNSDFWWLSRSKYLRLYFTKCKCLAAHEDCVSRQWFGDWVFELIMVIIIFQVSKSQKHSIEEVPKMNMLYVKFLFYRPPPQSSCFTHNWQFTLICL